MPQRGRLPDRDRYAITLTMAEALDELSEGQRACLRLVAQQQTSKDIARTLGISPHTVDQRLKVAMRILGVGNRRDAARMLAAHEMGYQSLVHQSPDIADGPPAPPASSPSGSRSHDRKGNGARGRIEANADEHFETFRSPRRSRVPYPRTEGQRNELTIVERLAAIFVIAITAAMAFGAILAGLEALGQLF